MRKPQSIPSDQNRRRLVTEAFTVRWRVDGQPHRMTIEPWGASYEPSIPKLHPVLNGLMLIVGWPMALYYDWLWLLILVIAWTVLMAPAALMGVLAPREALSPVSAVHDYIYRNDGKVQYEALHDGEWRPSDYMTRKQADAVMQADPDDPFWLSALAYLYVRAVGWWTWENE